MFSRIYLMPEVLSRDSTRFRARLSGYMFEDKSIRSLRAEIAHAIKAELGVSVPWVGSAYSIDTFLRDCELRDVLDMVTVVYRVLKRNHGHGTAEAWKGFVNRALNEEGLSYSVDKNCVIHYLVDEEFTQARYSVIQCLSSSRYAAVLRSVEDTYSKLDSEPFDQKGAVRDMFEAAEIMAKLLIGKNQDLTERLINMEIRPLVCSFYSRVDSSAVSFAENSLQGFVAWVNGGHRYRHGQKLNSQQCHHMN